MAYSTEDELKNNVKLLEQTLTAVPLTALYAERVAMADKIVEVDCNKYIDFSVIPDDSTTPVVNLLSQYKTAEMTQVRLSSVTRKVTEINDVTYWQEMYDALKKKIADGEVDILLADGTTSVASSINRFSVVSRKGVKPRFGFDKFGQFADNDRMKDIRDNETGGY